MVWRRSAGTSDDYEDARRGYLLGKMVHDLRTELGMSQAELASRAGMTQPQISRLEGGAVTPTIPLLERLAAAMGVELTIGFTAGSSALPPSSPE